jgi:hypothetical protein
MANYALSRLEHLYLQMETTYGQIPNTAGTATVANANACRFIKWMSDTQAALIERPDKTGTRSAMVGVLGRKYARWSGDMSIAPNGVAGTVPDMDPLMQAAFGQAGVATSGTSTITAASNTTPIVVTAANTFANGDVIFISGATGNTAANGVWVLAGVSGTGYTLVGSAGNGAWVSGGTGSRVGYRYSLSDNIMSFSGYSFRQPSTIDQRVALGAVVTETSFQLGADVAQASFNGESLWSLSANQFSVADLIQKGGLTAFPTEPAAPVTNGGIIAGFTGKIAVNSNAIATIRTATVRIQTGNVLVKDTFGSYYPTSAEGDIRRCSIQFSLYEDDGTAFQNLLQIAHDKTPVQIPLFLGTASGSIFGVILNNVQLAPPTREEQRRFIANFPESTAHGSSLTVRDECSVVFI